MKHDGIELSPALTPTASMFKVVRKRTNQHIGISTANANVHVFARH